MSGQATVDVDRYATSSERAKRAREQLQAACFATVAFGVLLVLWVAVRALLLRRVPAELIDDVILVVLGFVFAGLGLGIWQRRRWCAATAIVLLAGFIAWQVWWILWRGQPTGLMFFLVVPLVPAIADWVALGAMRQVKDDGTTSAEL
ncbi:MAG: hypothetical protein ACE5K7_00260 [Phycisphaerae bacterium]